MLRKVVYFDEGSATDFLQIQYEGMVEVSSAEDKASGYQFKVNGKAEGKVGQNFLSLIKASLALSGEAGAEKSKNSLVKTTISNTLLSDFVSFADDPEENNGGITVFKNYSLVVVEDSLAFIKMYAPFIKILKEGTEMTRELEEINFSEADEILRNARGYYEMLAKNGEETVILRFNINAFRNSYTLSDLTKMDLTFYGIKVGRCSEEDLKIENEFPQNEQKVEKIRPSTEEIFTSTDSQPQLTEVTSESEDLYDIYDVFLAGISSVVEK